MSSIAGLDASVKKKSLPLPGIKGWIFLPEAIH
jgi:hypothetical protein